MHGRVDTDEGAGNARETTAGGRTATFEHRGRQPCSSSTSEPTNDESLIRRNDMQRIQRPPCGPTISAGLPHGRGGVVLLRPLVWFLSALDTGPGATAAMASAPRGDGSRPQPPGRARRGAAAGRPARLAATRGEEMMGTSLKPCYLRHDPRGCYIGKIEEPWKIPNTIDIDKGSHFCPVGTRRPEQRTETHRAGSSTRRCRKGRHPAIQSVPLEGKPLLRHAPCQPARSSTVGPTEGRHESGIHSIRQREKLRANGKRIRQAKSSGLTGTATRSSCPRHRARGSQGAT